jgi:hypothetical protein
VRPSVLGADTLPASPVLVLMALGILIAIGGHVVGNARVVGLGVPLLFLATALMILGGFAAYEGGEQDPRPADDPF